MIQGIKECANCKIKPCEPTLCIHFLKRERSRKSQKKKHN